MSKSTTTNSAASNLPPSLAASSKPKASHDPWRETIESIAFAFVLALLFRTFVAEAFVIPTGSMAPTLFGRNKDVVCNECRFQYQVGASDEVDEDGYLVRRIEDSTCPNCRHVNKIRDLPVFKGDRILVNKFPYQMGDPKRWDVVVFRYPEDPQKNYIKRLVGLPGESIKISRGDVYAREGDRGEFKILRKDNPNKQKVLQQLVYDDRFPPVDLLNKGWPERWSSMSRSADQEKLDGWKREDSGWSLDPKARSYSVGSSEDLQWLRYQHLIPQRDDWSSAPSGDQNRPQLITDFCGYNAFTGGRGPNYDDDRFWVGDLTINATIEISSIQGEQSEIVLELVEGVRRYQCRIKPTSGEASLWRNDELAAEPFNATIAMGKAPTPINKAGKYTITFANVDDRLCLWVNSTWINSGLIPFGDDASYVAPENRKPQESDLVPVGIAMKGVKATVSELLLERDIYYRAESVPNSSHYEMHEPELTDSIRIRESLSDPVAYGDQYARNAREVTFRGLSSSEFFVMGDNSPRSQDSRLWPNDRHAFNRHAVPRAAMLGKAFFIYWPHGVPFLNGGRGFTLRNHSIAVERMGRSVENYPEYVFPFYPQWWRWRRIL